MASVRLIPRVEWEKRLHAQGCKRFHADRSGLETGEWWVTKSDKLFIVPCDDRGGLRMDDWQQVAVQLAKLKPLDWDT